MTRKVKITLKELQHFDPVTGEKRQPTLWEKIKLLWWRLWNPQDYDDLIKIITDCVEDELAKERMRKWKAGEKDPKP